MKILYCLTSLYVTASIRHHPYLSSSSHTLVSLYALSASVFIYLAVTTVKSVSTFTAYMDIDPHSHLRHSRNFTYFSFFLNLHQSDDVVTTIVETLAISTVFLVSVAANAGAAALVTWERRLLANKTILTLNLFVADLLFVSTIPVIVAVRWTVSWTLGYTTCHTLLYVICMSGCVTITTLACISVERVQAILQLQTVPTLNTRMVTVTIIFIWAFSALTSIPLSLFFTVIEMHIPGQVWMNWWLKEKLPALYLPLMNIFLCIFFLFLHRNIYKSVLSCGLTQLERLRGA